MIAIYLCLAKNLVVVCVCWRVFKCLYGKLPAPVSETQVGVVAQSLPPLRQAEVQIIIVR